MAATGRELPMTPGVPQTMHVDEWVKKLTTIPEKDFTIPRVEKFVHENLIDPDSLQPYIFYARSHYTRNLIFKNPLFEIIAICWESGQVSRIHNHRGQNCWMAVPIGKLRVQNFRVEQQDPVHGTCKLVRTDYYDMDATHPGIVRPEEPVHQVLNLPEFGARSTTVHIYSYPYSSCEIYSLEKGNYTDVPLHYSSQYGQLSPDEKLL
jgi:cysteine dioxygenase